jgi:Zn-dependent protease with chaperone function
MVGSILLSWLVIFDAEQVLLGQGNRPRSSRREVTGQRLRTFAGLVLVPLGMLFLGRDILTMLYPDGIDPVIAGVASILFLLLLLSLYPWLLSLTWKTRRIGSPALARELKQAAREAGLSGERFRVWDTNLTITNALVAGVIPGLRCVFLTDRLLEKFEADEVVAVCRHELGHLVHSHLHMRMALVLVPLLALTAIAVLTSPPAEATDYHAMSWHVSVWMLCGMAFLGYLAGVVARFIRKSEVQADLFAICRKDGRVCASRARSYSNALLKLAADSPEMLERSTAVHPSIRLRIEIIRQVVEQPEKTGRFTQKFRQEQQLAAICLVALVVIAALAGSLP